MGEKRKSTSAPSRKIEMIRTPIPMLQIVTAGGIRFSTLVELWGANRAGKSTTCYQTAGYFLEDYGDKAQVKIIDSETSADFIRLLAFGVDIDNDPRVEVTPALFLEEGFFKIFEWVKDLPDDHYMLIIWDTISSCNSRQAYEEAENAKTAEKLNINAGGMGTRQKVLKHYLRQVMGKIYAKKISVWLPNQVFASMDQFSPKEQSGEGNALKHDTHYSLHFQRGGRTTESSDKKKDIDYENSVAKYTVSRVSLTKSKFSPEFERSPIYIDNTRGGVIDEMHSLFLHALEKGRLEKNSQGRYLNVIPGRDTGILWGDLVKSQEAYEHILCGMVSEIREKHPVIDRMYQNQEIPSLGGESLSEGSPLVTPEKHSFDVLASLRNRPVQPTTPKVEDAKPEEEKPGKKKKA
jgi:RecA/RadA recombinase